MTNREIINDMGYEDSVIFINPDYDSAIVGVSDNGAVIYDYDLMVKHLMDTDGMTADEAVEFIDYTLFGRCRMLKNRDRLLCILFGSFEQDNMYLDTEKRENVI